MGQLIPEGTCVQYAGKKVQQLSTKYCDLFSVCCRSRITANQKTMILRSIEGNGSRFELFERIPVACFLESAAEARGRLQRGVDFCTGNCL